MKDMLIQEISRTSEKPPVPASSHQSQEQTKEHSQSEVDRPACFEAESKTTFEAESRELTMADRQPMMQTECLPSAKITQRAGSQGTALSRNTG